MSSKLAPAREIKDSNYSEHNILIYKNLGSFRSLYSDYAKEALAGDKEIVLIFSTYESLQQVKRQLQEKGVDVNYHIKAGSLAIIDAVQAYQTADQYGAQKLALASVARAVKEGKRGVSGFADMGSFFHVEKIERLIQYELSLPKVYDKTIKLKSFCSYHKDDFDRLSNDHKEALLNHHNRNIVSD